MTKNTSITLMAATLLVGLVFGYGIAMARSHSMGQMNHQQQNTHTMPDGSVMFSDGNIVHEEENMMDMGEMMEHMNKELAQKSGDAFDEAFLSEMIVHHQGAVDMAQAALSQAKHQEIKDLSAQIISTQNKEISDMKLWLKQWYNK